VLCCGLVRNSKIVVIAASYEGKNIAEWDYIANKKLISFAGVQ